MKPLADTHTHRPDAPDGVINYDPAVASYPLNPALHYSVGIHPWHAAEATPELLDRLAAMAGESNVIAIGETGLDSLRGPAMEVQIPLFKWHIDLALAIGKPLIIHSVRAWQVLSKIARRYPLKPQPWIIHGFRGKPGLARQLLREGFSLSFGQHYNPLSFAATPVDRRYAESDESILPDLPGEVNHIARASAQS